MGIFSQLRKNTLFRLEKHDYIFLEGDGKNNLLKVVTFKLDELYKSQIFK